MKYNGIIQNIIRAEGTFIESDFRWILASTRRRRIQLTEGQFILPKADLAYHALTVHREC